VTLHVSCSLVAAAAFFRADDRITGDGGFLHKGVIFVSVVDRFTWSQETYAYGQGREQKTEQNKNS